MFFVLSKTIGYLAMPFVDVCILFLVSGCIRNVVWKKRLFWIALGSLLFFSNAFIANEMMLLWEIEPTSYQDVDKTYSMGIVLTGVTAMDKKPFDRVYFNHGADRVVHTVDLYKRGIIKKILVSGRSGKLFGRSRSEAGEIQKALILMGVTPHDILLEEVSRNTHESAIEVKNILKQETVPPDSCLLITSAFHLRRAVGCYQKEGMNVDMFSTDFYTYSRKFSPDEMIIPSVNALFTWHRLVREWIGYMMYKLAGYV